MNISLYRNVSRTFVMGLVYDSAPTGLTKLNSCEI